MADQGLLTEEEFDEEEFKKRQRSRWFMGYIPGVRLCDPKLWHKVAALSGIAAVGFGTYGSHLYKPQNVAYKDVYNTANLYHLMHTAALVAAPVTKRPHVFGGLLTFGIVAFCGTCYAVALLEDRKYAMGAPFGGFAFVAGWASLLF